MATIDLNADLGEGVGEDAAMFALVSSANIACGGHTGDDDSMRQSVEFALRNGVALGAHPSYADREGFGRRDQDVEPGVLTDDILRQTSALITVAGNLGVQVRYLKPHGALYNRIVHDEAHARAVVDAAATLGLPILGLPGSAVERIATERIATERIATERTATQRGIRFFREAFIDRAYQPDGTLVPRGRPDALIRDPDHAAERAIRIVVEREAEALGGTIIRLDVDSLCVHGDTPEAVALAHRVRERFRDEGIDVRPFT